MKEEEILRYINKLRANPAIVMDELKYQLSRFETNNIYRNHHQEKIRTQSGKKAWQQAILSLQRQKSKTELIWNNNLSEAASEYKKLSEKNISPINHHEILNTICEAVGSISFTLNSCLYNQSCEQLLASMIVCDSDETKTSKTALFHPSYRLFGCATAIKGNRLILYCFFAQQVMPLKINNEVKVHKQLWSSNKQVKVNDQFGKFEVQDLIKRGRQFIMLLNKIRKDPKNYIHTLNKQMQKFKDEHKLVAQYGQVEFKQGKGSFCDLISELQTQYPLPSLKEVNGLSLTALEQLREYQSISIKQNRTKFEETLSKYCIQCQNVKSFRQINIKKWPISAILMIMLASDNDKKRTIRRKLMSPISKNIGCVINEGIVIVNVGQLAKDKKSIKNSTPEPIQKQEEKGLQIGNHQGKNIIKHENSESKSNSFYKDKIIAKRSIKSHIQQIEGRSYEVKLIQIQYTDGKTETIREQVLIQ